MFMQTNMHEAKSRLSQLVAKAEAGEVVIIAKAGKPCVQLIPVKQNKERMFGQFKGQFTIYEDFDSETTSKEISDLFEAGL